MAETGRKMAAYDQDDRRVNLKDRSVLSEVFYHSSGKCKLIKFISDMKIIPFILSVALSLSFISLPQYKPSIGITATNHADSNKWTDSFLELRKAIAAGDRDAVKTFIDFPIRNKGNEIWYVADSRLVMEIDPKVIKPFTEADFDKYFSPVFGIDLRKTLGILNTEEFFRTNKSTTPEIEVVKDSKSKLTATCNKSAQKVTLTLITTGKGGIWFSIAYLFDITTDQRIRFRSVHAEG